MKKARFYFTLAALSGMVIGCQEFAGQGQTVAAAYEIARQLGYNVGVSVESLNVRPRVEIPITRSGLDIDIVIGVQNPVDFQIRTQSFSGTVGIEQKGTSYVLGNVGSKNAVYILPKAKGTIPITMRLSYEDVKDAWTPISNVTLGQASVWKLNGTLEIEVAGTVVPVPIQYSKPVN